MTKTESIIHSILGTSRKDIRPFTCCIELIAEQIFVQKTSMSNIVMTKDIYSSAAEHLQKSMDAVSRATQRLANDCWDKLVEKDLVIQYIGQPIYSVPSPSSILVYFAFYTYLDMPFFTALEQMLGQL